MKTIAHVSDLHFGTEVAAVAEALIIDLQATAPSLVIVSGDLTQRARQNQFAAAREYLARLPHPQLVVPGNHDVPLYNVAARLLTPLAGYRRHITADLAPMFADTEMLVFGVNTTRSTTIRDGAMRSTLNVFAASRIRVDVAVPASTAIADRPLR